MSDTIMVALITGAITLLSNIVALTLNTRVMTYKIEALEKAHSELRETVRDEIKGLTDKVGKYNNLNERVAVIDQTSKSAHKRIDEIKGGH